MVSLRRSRRVSRLWCTRAALVLLLVLPCSQATAQSEKDKERAADAMQRGEAEFERGSFRTALEYYRQADAIMGVPTTRLAVAKALERMGKLTEAREVADGISQMPKSSPEPAAFVKARSGAVELLEQLDARIPSLTITVENLPEGTQPTVRIDGVLANAGRWGATQKVNPGTLRVSALAAGFPEVVQTVVVAERDSKTVVLRFPKAVEPPVRRSAGIPTVSWIGFGIGGAALATGVVTGILTINRTNDLKDECGGNVCERGRYEDHYNTTRALGWTSNISFALAALGVGLGSVALLSSTRDSPKAVNRGAAAPHVSLSLSPTQCSLEGSF